MMLITWRIRSKMVWISRWLVSSARMRMQQYIRSQQRLVIRMHWWRSWWICRETAKLARRSWMIQIRMYLPAMNLVQIWTRRHRRKLSSRRRMQWARWESQTWQRISCMNIWRAFRQISWSSLCRRWRNRRRVCQTACRCPIWNLLRMRPMMTTLSHLVSLMRMIRRSSASIRSILSRRKRSSTWSKNITIWWKQTAKRRRKSLTQIW